jgi:hypothetical protein
LGLPAVQFVAIGRERRDRERPGTIRVDRRRCADAVLTHQGAQARQQRRQLFGRRLRARIEGVLHHPARRRIDDNRHAIDGRRRRVRIEVEQQQRAQRPHVAGRRRQLQMAFVARRLGACAERRRREQAKLEVQRRGAAVASLETL